MGLNTNLNTIPYFEYVDLQSTKSFRLIKRNNLERIILLLLKAL